MIVGNIFLRQYSFISNQETLTELFLWYMLNDLPFQRSSSSTNETIPVKFIPIRQVAASDSRNIQH